MVSGVEWAFGRSSFACALMKLYKIRPHKWHYRKLADSFLARVEAPAQGDSVDLLRHRHRPLAMLVPQQNQFP